MKKSFLPILIVSILLFLFLIGGFFASYIYKAVESQSIVNVINQSASAAQNSMQISRKYRRFLGSKYVGELHKIDTSACPKKFQLVWLNYVHAWELQAQQTPGTRLAEAYLGAVGVITHSTSFEKIGTRGIETADATTLAWQNVETVALEYDVRMKYQ
jgi:hypothetical protein